MKLNIKTAPHQLFPYHWNPIWSLNTPGEKPNYATLNKWKSQANDIDRMWADENCLIGVRFDSKVTRYLMLDIDVTSPYHPDVSRSEWNRLLLTLEESGLTEQILVRSSYSQGIHAYYFLGEDFDTVEIGQFLWSIFTKNGFVVRQGDLETFPNAKPWTKDHSDFLAHRLPLQPGTGSYLIDKQYLHLDEWEEFAARAMSPQQDLETLRKQVQWGVAYYKKHKGHCGISSSAVEWKCSLEGRLDLGWTMRGQTNEILRTACVNSWVFGGSSDIDEVVKKVVGLPGYQEFCGHQDEIQERVTDWMACVLRRYYPYGRPDLKPGSCCENTQIQVGEVVKKERERSTKRKDDVIDRLRGTVAALLQEAHALPQSIIKIKECLQQKAKELYGKAFGTDTLNKSEYRLEWRILVEEAQRHTKRAIDPISVDPIGEQKSTSNSLPVTNRPDSISMKVLWLLNISINRFLLVAQVFNLFSSGISSSAEFITLEARSLLLDIFPCEFVFELLGSSIETDLISPAYDLLPAAATLSNIRFTNEPTLTISPLGGEDGSNHFPAPLFSTVEEESDEHSGAMAKIGDLLERLPSTSFGIFYPSILARIEEIKGGSYILRSPTGGSLRCPIELLGITWVRPRK